MPAPARQRSMVSRWPVRPGRLGTARNCRPMRRPWASTLRSRSRSLQPALVAPRRQLSLGGGRARLVLLTRVPSGDGLAPGRAIAALFRGRAGRLVCTRRQDARREQYDQQPSHHAPPGTSAPAQPRGWGEDQGSRDCQYPPDPPLGGGLSSSQASGSRLEVRLTVMRAQPTAKPAPAQGRAAGSGWTRKATRARWAGCANPVALHNGDDPRHGRDGAAPGQ
jgi:hypothetical protein